MEAEKNYINEKMSPLWCHHKKLHGGEVFEAAMSFPPGKLPIKIIEHLVQQGMLPKKHMKDGCGHYRVMSVHSMGVISTCCIV